MTRQFHPAIALYQQRLAQTDRWGSGHAAVRGDRRGRVAGHRRRLHRSQHHSQPQPHCRCHGPAPRGWPRAGGPRRPKPGTTSRCHEEPRRWRSHTRPAVSISSQLAKRTSPEGEALSTRNSELDPILPRSNAARRRALPQSSTRPSPACSLRGSGSSGRPRLLQPTVAPGRPIASRFFRSRHGPSEDCRRRPCGTALPGSPMVALFQE